MQHKGRCIFLVLFAGFFSTHGQTRSIDSLKEKLGGASGVQRVDLLNELTFELINRDNERVMEYFNQSLQLSHKLGYPRGIGRAYTYKGVSEYLTGEFSDGRYHLRLGLNLSIKNNDRPNTGYALMQLGNSFLNQTELDSAEFYYNRSYPYLKDSTNALNLSKLYRSMVSLYGLRSQTSLEKKYLVRCIRIRELLNNHRFTADALILYASIQIKEGNFEEAQKNLNTARVLLNKVKHEAGETISDWQYLQGVLYLQLNKFELAHPLFDSASIYFATNGILVKYVRLQTDLGTIFNTRGDYDFALKCLEDALKIARPKKFAVELSDINNQIGWAVFNLGSKRDAAVYADSAIRWVRGKNIPDREADALILKGISNSYLKDFNVAESSLLKALEIRKQLGDPEKIAVVNTNIGFMEIQRRDYTKALKYFMVSKSILENFVNDGDKAWCNYGLGNSYLKLGQFSLSQKFLGVALEKALFVNEKELVLLIYIAEKDLLTRLDNPKEALRFANLAYTLQDSLHRNDIGQRFASIQHSEEIRTRDLDIQSLKKQKELANDLIVFQRRSIFFSIVLIFLLGVAAIIYAIFYRRFKRLHQAVQQQKEELQQQSSYITELNHNLENMVAEKTMDLQITNHELLKQNNDLLQFSYTVSHNLRGPVARLLGLTNIMQYSQNLGDQNQMVDYIRQASKDLDQTLGDLSKIIDIKNDLHNANEWVNLKEEWLKSCAVLEDVISKEFEITTNFEKTDAIFTITAFIQSLFYNLISNAIKYRSKHRVLQITATSRTENERVILEIADNGLGIDLDKHHASVFKLFKRFHTHVEGRGLGLYLIKSQVEALNGTIEISSQVDKGTMFKVSFPLVKEYAVTPLIKFQ